MHRPNSHAILLSRRVFRFGSFERGGANFPSTAPCSLPEGSRGPTLGGDGPDQQGSVCGFRWRRGRLVTCRLKKLTRRSCATTTAGSSQRTTGPYKAHVRPSGTLRGGSAEPGPQTAPLSRRVVSSPGLAPLTCVLGSPRLPRTPRDTHRTWRTPAAGLSHWWAHTRAHPAWAATALVSARVAWVVLG